MGLESKALQKLGLIMLMVFSLSPPFIGVATASEPITPLEMAVFGKKFEQEPLLVRVQRLERALNQKAVPTSSLSYRISRLYAVQKQQAASASQAQAIQFYNKGVDAYEQKQYEQAVASYEKAIALNPDLIPAYNNLGSLLEQLGQYSNALQVYQKAILSDPKNPLLVRNLAIMYEKTGKIEKALDYYRHYIALEPSPDPNIARIVSEYDTARRKYQNLVDYAAVASEGSDGKTLIWPSAMMPIPVYVAIEADQGPFLKPVQEALAAWESATSGRIRFREVAQPELARIHIILQDGPLSHPYLEVGHASFAFDASTGKQDRNLHVNVTVNTGERDAPISLTDRLSQVRRLALHEIGHAIGIWGHSPDPADVMYAQPIAEKLSSRDVITIQRLYGIYSGDSAVTRARRRVLQSFDRPAFDRSRKP